jgi:hypothetical protein
MVFVRILFSVIKMIVVAKTEKSSSLLKSSGVICLPYIMLFLVSLFFIYIFTADSLKDESSKKILAEFNSQADQIIIASKVYFLDSKKNASSIEVLVSEKYLLRRPSPGDIDSSMSEWTLDRDKNILYSIIDNSSWVTSDLKQFCLDIKALNPDGVCYEYTGDISIDLSSTGAVNEKSQRVFYAVYL